MLNLGIGIGIFSLIIYILVILLLNTKLKRKMDECMFWGFCILLIITAIFKGNMTEAFQKSLKFGFKQEVVYAAMIFSFMAVLMQKTGVINRLVNILNSFLGRFRGGAAYVSTIASALFGMISGSGSGNAAAVGAITIPWMKQTGWNSEMSTTIVAGNAGLGICFPPSSSMFLLLGMPVISSELTSSNLYITLMSGALIILLYRLILIRYYVAKYKIQATTNEQTKSLNKVFTSNCSSLLIFLGVLIPIFITSGSFSNYLTNNPTFGEKALKAISLITWIPVLIIIITFIEGWKYLPKKINEWSELCKKAMPSFASGVLLFFAFASSRLLINLGLEEEVTTIFSYLANYSKYIVIIGLAILSLLMVGPFTGTATTTAIGSVGYIALRSINVPPTIACTTLLIMFSNESCMPPNSAPVYIASSISSLEDPGSTFIKLILHFAFPTVFLAILMSLGIIPLP